MGLFTRNPPAGQTNSSATAVAERPTSSEITAPPAPPQMRAPVPPPVVTPQSAERNLQFEQLKVRIHQQLVERLDVQNLRTLPIETVRQEVRVVIKDLCQSEKGLLNSADQERLMDDVMNETFGLGPLEGLLKGLNDLRYSDQSF